MVNYFGRKKNQSGLAVIEFTIVFVVLLLMLFAIFEIGRYVFNLQMLNEITRRTARIAAVCHPDDRANIPQLSVIADVLPPGVETSDIIISYLDEDGDELEGNTIDLSQVWFVRAEIKAVDYDFLYIFNDLGVIQYPDFKTTLPAENLGLLRYGSKADEYADCSD